MAVTISPLDTETLNVTVNGEPKRLNIDPRTSLLDLLREHLQLTGAKKGCDHGQCGACTVHLDGRRVVSCLTLALQADGRDVTTIEGLSAPDGPLHPMQQAFIDHDALQCGYCTPGQIMAAVACVREGHARSPELIREYMSGNLCRCGAYPGILAAIQDAAKRMAEGRSMQRLTYSRARTPRDAVLALADGGPGTRLIAGGTTLYDLMKLNVETPTALVDVSRLRELEAFDTSGRNELVFGAMARMSDVAADARLVREYPALSESLWRAASQQLRNMATVGGNLLQRTRCAYFRFGEPFACNKRQPGSGCAAIGGLDRGHAVLGTSDSCIAVYPGDWAVALVAFDAQVDTISPRGERTLPVESLHQEPGTTPNIESVLERDEMIIQIRVPTTPVGRGSIYHKIRDRESYAFALASAAAAVRLARATSWPPSTTPISRRRDTISFRHSTPTHRRVSTA
jgi:xanthine dehydrogenase YagS FAD-binding subunit